MSSPDQSRVAEWAREAAAQRGVGDPAAVVVRQLRGPHGTIVVSANWPAPPGLDGVYAVTGVATEDGLAVDPPTALGRLLAAWERAGRDLAVEQVALLAGLVLAGGEKHFVAVKPRDVADLRLPASVPAGPPTALTDGIEFWWEDRDGVHRIRLRLKDGSASIEWTEPQAAAEGR